jgi:iron complex outermembrane receptor protein
MFKLAKTILAIMVFLLPLFAMAQEKSIRGKLTDKAGNDIPDATIFLKGISVSSRSDAGGNFF